MTIAIQKTRMAVVALLLASAMTLGINITPMALPRAHADDDYEMILVAQAWADAACTTGRADRGAAIESYYNVKDYRGYLSSRDIWRVITIGAASGCPALLDYIDPSDVPDIAPYLGSWMYSNREGLGLNAAYRNHSAVCTTITSQGAAVAVDSFYADPLSYPLTPSDVKKAAVVGLLTFCPWNLPLLRAYYGE